MGKKLEDGATTRRVVVQVPSVAPISAHHPGQGGSRSLFTDATVCFIATALGSLSPQALNLLDLAPEKPLAFNIDPQSGKFIDRILVGGLRPLSWEEESAPPTPAFLSSTPQSAVHLTGEEAPRQVAAASVKLARETATSRKIEKGSEKVGDATPAPPIRPVAEPVLTQVRSEATEEGMAPALTPSSLSTKLAPVGQKLWSGAKRLGDALTGGVSWLGY